MEITAEHSECGDQNSRCSQGGVALTAMSVNWKCEETPARTLFGEKVILSLSARGYERGRLSESTGIAVLPASCSRYHSRRPIASPHALSPKGRNSSRLVRYEIWTCTCDAEQWLRTTTLITRRHHGTPQGLYPRI